MKLSKPSLLISHIFITSLIMLVFGILSGCKPSDEQVLRNAFDLPASAKLVTIDSYPKTSGLYGREGGKIWATFEFSS